MAITNLHLAKKLDGKTPVNRQDITVGFQCYFPSGHGGIERYECAELSEQHAIFIPVDEESAKIKWKGFKVDFNAQDMTAEMLSKLPEALKRFGIASKESREDRLLVHFAGARGLISIQSHTQASWTSKGLELVNQMNG